MQVREVMHHGIDCVSPSCSVRDVARIMKRRNIGALTVREHRKLVGIVTDRDLVVRVLAGGLSPAKTTVRDVMTPNPVCAHKDDDIVPVARTMEENKVRRMPVLDRRQHLAGMLSVDDLTRRGAGQDLIAEILEATAARHA